MIELGPNQQRILKAIQEGRSTFLELELCTKLNRRIITNTVQELVSLEVLRCSPTNKITLRNPLTDVSTVEPPVNKKKKKPKTVSIETSSPKLVNLARVL